MNSQIRKLIIIIALTVIATYISLPSRFSILGKNIERPNLNIKIGSFNFNKNFDTKLGLDLAGGSHLVFDADMSKIDGTRSKEALESVRDVIDRRVNLFGVSEPTVQTSTFDGKNRIIVELPGVKDTKEAVDLIGKTAQLIFSEVIEIPGIEGATPSAQIIPTDLTGADLQSAQVTFDSKDGKPVISLQFTKVGGDKFAIITERTIGTPIPIVLDSAVVSAPMVQEKITGGSAQISGAFTVDEAKKVSIQLNAGALPVPIVLIEERTVGATLGAESIKQSVIAGIVGIAMVIVFMILSYRGLGIIAAIGLFIFSVITLALYK